MILHHVMHWFWQWITPMPLRASPSDTKRGVLCGEPVGVELHLQRHVQLGLERRLRQLFAHHLIHHECKGHAFLPGEQHGGVRHRYVAPTVSGSGRRLTRSSVVKWQPDVFGLPLPGSALDLNFSDIDVASLEKELEEQDDSVGLASKDDSFSRARFSGRSGPIYRMVRPWFTCKWNDVVPAGQRLLAGSAPVNIPGSLARSSSFHSSSSLSTSPLGSLSQSLSQSLLSATLSQRNHSSNVLAKQEHGLLGTLSSSSQNSLGRRMASGVFWGVSWKSRFKSQSFIPMTVV